MTISDYILDYLNRYGKVEIMNFGVFYFRNTQAELMPNENIILPPAKRVFFQENKNIKGHEFIHYLSQKKDISLKNAQFELQTQVDFWQKKISSKDEFSIPHLGTFFSREEHFTFQGERIEKKSPDFFGLEKINYTDFQKAPHTRSTQTKNKDHSATKYALYFFLIIIPLVGIAFAIYQYQDIILGKKNTNDIVVKTSTHRIEKTLPKVTKDSVTIDSIAIKKDTLKIVTP